MLMLLTESLRAAAGSVNAHRFRAFLTSLGIIVGVASIVALAAVIQGLSNSVTQMFEGLGSNNLTVTSFTSTEQQLSDRQARLNVTDFDLVAARVPGISALTPIVFSQRGTGSVARVGYGSRFAYPRVVGTTPSYQKLGQQVVKYGRFISSHDSATRRRIAVIGEAVRHKLGLPENPVGQYIETNGEWVKVVGLIEPKGDTFGYDQDDFVLLPYETMQSMIGDSTQADLQILLQVEDFAAVDVVREDLRRVLRAAHRLEADEQDDFKIQTPEQLLESFSQFVRRVTYFTLGIISISLLVGGIGIMNIMLVSVNERTREIGICKAIGAKRYHILLQFLLEALIVSLLGGVAGIVIGYALAALISVVLGFPPAQVPLWAGTVSFGFSLFVGVFFGLLPAAKAAGLTPIEALRYE